MKIDFNQPDIEQPHPSANGTQKLWAFKNGYGASVIKFSGMFGLGSGSYGSEKGLWELAIKHPEQLCYATPITDDVMGHLSPEKVEEILEKISQLPENKSCSHKRK